MPILENRIQEFIDAQLIADNKARSEEHKSSGKLSASMLYQPLRFQVLKTLGAPRKEFNAYTLGKFKRGTDVEDWYVEQLRIMGVLSEAQKEIEYRGCVGYVDAVINSEDMSFNDGLIPHEVKSVTNAKLKRIKKTGVDYHYKLQATLYALAMETDHYAIDIISAEDLRVGVYIFQTSELKSEVDSLISNYMEAMDNFKKDRTLPEFEPNPKVPWTANLNYAMFEPFWAEEPDSLVIKELDRLGLL